MSLGKVCRNRVGGPGSHTMPHRSAVPMLYLPSLCLPISLSLSCLSLLHITQLPTTFLGVSLLSVSTIEDQNSFGLIFKKLIINVTVLVFANKLVKIRNMRFSVTSIHVPRLKAEQISSLHSIAANHQQLLSEP